jgi:hypothetical protein
MDFGSLLVANFPIERVALGDLLQLKLRPNIVSQGSALSLFNSVGTLSTAFSLYRAPFWYRALTCSSL